MILKPRYEIATAESGGPRSRRSTGSTPTSSSWTSRCRRWTASSCSSGSSAGPEHRNRDDHRLRLARHREERADARGVRVPDQALQPQGPGGHGAARARAPADGARHAHASSPCSSMRCARCREEGRGLEEEARRRTGGTVAPRDPALDPPRDLAGHPRPTGLRPAHKDDHDAAAGRAGLRRGGRPPGRDSARGVSARAPRSSAPS